MEEIAYKPIKRPPIRYPGSKFRIAKKIIQYYPPYDLYAEPYVGGGGSFFLKPKSYSEVINDLNGDVTNVYRVLRDPVLSEKLKELCLLTPMARREWKESYELTDDPLENARRTIFRSFASIGSDGIGRPLSGFRGLKNNEGALTSAHEWKNYPKHIASFLWRLQGVLIEEMKALKFIRTYDSATTFFYCDPPYLKSTRKSHGWMYTVELGKNKEDEIQAHRDLAATLHEIKGKAIISHYDCDLYQELYEGWQKVSFAARAFGNKPRVECIWISPNIQPQLC